MQPLLMLPVGPLQPQLHAAKLQLASAAAAAAAAAAEAAASPTKPVC
jgi:hypothetical protein